MYDLVDKSGNVVGQVDSFRAAQEWANQEGGRSVYSPNVRQIIFTNTAGGTAFPDFQVGTYTPTRQTAADPVPGPTAAPPAARTQTFDSGDTNRTPGGAGLDDKDVLDQNQGGAQAGNSGAGDGGGAQTVRPATTYGPTFVQDLVAEFRAGDDPGLTLDRVREMMRAYSQATFQGPFNHDYNGLDIFFKTYGADIYQHPTFGAEAINLHNQLGAGFEVVPPSNVADPFAPTKSEIQLSESASRAGRGNLFNRFASAQDLGGLSQSGRGAVYDRFNPLSARFVLDRALDPTPFDEGFDAGASNFRTFLESAGAQGLDRAGFQERLGRLLPLFRTSETDLSVDELSRKQFLQEGRTAENIITEAIAAGSNPLFRNFIPGIVDRRISAFQDQNPERDLLTAFVANGFTF